MVSPFDGEGAADMEMLSVKGESAANESAAGTENGTV
jgi:hypothetical protein